MHCFYQVLADPCVAVRWFLSEPTDAHRNALDDDDFTRGRPYDGGAPASVRVCADGPPVGFNFGGFDMPVVRDGVATVIRSTCGEDVQLFPVTVVGHTDRYWVLNAVHTIDCFDEAASEFVPWTAEDGRPDRMGDYRMVLRLRIDPERVTGHDLFRIRGWLVALIVSARLKDALEQMDNLAIVFSPVS